MNPGARSAGGDVLERLRSRLPGYDVVDFPPAEDLGRLVGEGSLVVAAGGDGTVGALARLLAGTGCPLGIVPTGTFNNFARALGLPTDIDEAVDVIRNGVARPVAVGTVEGRVFVEAAAAGLFGEGIAAGEDLKDLEFGALAEHLRRLAAAGRFRYRVGGDVVSAGRAHSLIASNVPSTGSLIPVGSTDPAEPHLELAVASAGGRAGRLLGMLLRRPPGDPGLSRHFRRLSIETDPPVLVVADAQEVGTTPVEVAVVPDALRVILPP